jgi:hypothetical protein
MLLQNKEIKRYRQGTHPEPSAFRPVVQEASPSSNRDRPRNSPVELGLRNANNAAGIVIVLRGTAKQGATASAEPRWSLIHSPSIGANGMYMTGTCSTRNFDDAKLHCGAGPIVPVSGFVQQFVET